MSIGEGAYVSEIVNGLIITSLLLIWTLDFNSSKNRLLPGLVLLVRGVSDHHNRKTRVASEIGRRNDPYRSGNIALFSSVMATRFRLTITGDSSNVNIVQCLTRSFIENSSFVDRSDRKNKKKEYIYIYIFSLKINI